MSAENAQFVAGFQRTYEELKPVMICPYASNAPSRFQRTYEELKPGFLGFHSPAKLGFQRTYEELKLRRRSRRKAAFVVFSVPMRN